MALVMLPCDLPWWSVIQKKLKSIQQTSDLEMTLEIMQKLHDLCNVSLDPDEDKRDSTLMDGLKNFLLNEMDNDGRTHFLEHTINRIARRASELRHNRPPRGLEFSLQQHSDAIELNYKLVASLVANAFFSTFPKRTPKTHPTLQDFNFTNFFSGLETSSQKAKLRSLLYYFDWLDEAVDNDVGCIKISRKVMPGKQWLTIEDWLECGLPLCGLNIKHEGRLESSSTEIVQSVFVNPKVGGDVLYNGNSQESIQMSTIPETLIILLYMESLEDNEAIFIENVRQVARIIDPKRKTFFQKLESPKEVSLCCMDAENYSKFPISQFEEDNVLRELNKCLLAFRQNTKCPSDNLKRTKEQRDLNSNDHNDREREDRKRLSPIGESGSSSPKGSEEGFDRMKIIIKQASTNTRRSSTTSANTDEDIKKRRSWLQPDQRSGETRSYGSKDGSFVSGPVPGRRGRFIVLGSSGECLPVNRKRSSGSLNSSLNSSEEEFHSARDSFEGDGSDDDAKKYSDELNSFEKRNTFAQELKEALQSENINDSDDSGSGSYAIGISVSGSQPDDQEIRLRRGGSRGFMLTEDSLDDDFYKDSLMQETEWLRKFRNKQNGQLQRRDTNESSKYSFDTDCSSELEEIQDQFAKWLDDPANDAENTKLIDARDEAVLQFASSLLKRTLSESFVGVPLTDGSVSSMGIQADEETMQPNNIQKKGKHALNPRSLSLELAKHNHRLAAQLNFLTTHDRSSKLTKKPQKRWSISTCCTEQTVECDDVVFKISQITQKCNTKTKEFDVSPVATGNWGCGNSKRGDEQLKLVIQWMAASVAGLPVLVYFTSGNERLTKLDTVCRVLLDRKWTVGELASETLMHAKTVLSDPYDVNCECFFEKLIGLA